MFTWICPQCGREVPPSYNECPDCARKDAAPDTPGTPAANDANEEPAPAAVASPPAPVAPPRPADSAPRRPQARPYQPPAPAGRAALPTWLLTILFALAFFGLGIGIYWLVGAVRGSSAKPSAAVESPAAKPGASTSPYQKYIEISGVRFIQDPKKKTEARFVITNHSNADIPDLAGNVTIWGRTRNSEEDAAGTFTFNTSLKSFESKELTAPLNTKLKIYELPDWQNVSTDVQITSPGSGTK